MFYIGSLSDLAAEYRRSWSGRCRGNPRTAYVEGARGLDLRSDFVRWLNRKMKKEGIMFLQKETENKDFLIYIFRKDAVKVSPVRAVAEAILKFGDDPAGVPSSAINFCIAGHPHSGGQRFREICAAYRRQWPGVTLAETVKMLGSLFGQKIDPDNICAHSMTIPGHIYKNKRYYLSPAFMAWLRVNLPEIERVVYPVQARMKFKDDGK